MGSSISRLLEDEAPELPSRDLEPPVRPLHVRVEDPPPCSDRALPALDERHVLVPEREPTEAALVPELEVHDPPSAAILAGELPDGGHPDDLRPQARLGALLQVPDPRERRDAPALALHHGHGS